MQLCNGQSYRPKQSKARWRRAAKPPMVKQQHETGEITLKTDPEQHIPRLVRRKPHRSLRRRAFRRACRGMRADVTEPCPMSDRPVRRHNRIHGTGSWIRFCLYRRALHRGVHRDLGNG